MSTKTKKKLCWNCEGEVLLTATQCPFCGVNVEASSLQTNPHDPPYKLNAENVIPKSPFMNADSKSEPVEESKIPSNGSKSAVFSIVFMVVGATFALFGLVLLLFSDSAGLLTLKWKAEYWFIYVLSSLPMLYLGWKSSTMPPEQGEKDNHQE